MMETAQYISLPVIKDICAKGYTVEGCPASSGRIPPTLPIDCLHSYHLGEGYTKSVQARTTSSFAQVIRILDRLDGQILHPISFYCYDRARVITFTQPCTGHFISSCC